VNRLRTRLTLSLFAALAGFASLGATAVLWAGQAAALTQALVTAVAIAVAYVLCAALVARWFEPLSELRRRVRSLAEGRWDTPLPGGGSDEFGALARDVDSLRRAYLRLARDDESRLGHLLVLSRVAGLLDVNAGPRAVAQRALEIATRELPLRAGAVYLAYDEGRLFELSATLGLPTQLSAQALGLGSHQHLIGRLRRNQQVVVTDSAGAEEWLTAVGLETAAASLVVAIPLRSGDHLTGAMLLTSGAAELLPAEVEMLTSIGNQVGGALSTARAIEESRRRTAHLEGLLATSTEVARSLSEQQVLHVILAKARELMQVEACAVFRLDESTRRLGVRDAIGLASDFAAAAQFPIGEGAVGRAVKERRVVAIGHLPSDPHYERLARHVDEAHWVATLAAPLIAGDAVLGGLEVYSRDHREFTEEEQRLLAIFANQAAVAIVNAELHTSAQRRLHALDALFTTIESISVMGTATELMEFVICEVMRLFPCNVAYVLLENEATHELEVAASRGLAGASGGIATTKCWAIKKSSLFQVDDDQRDFTCPEVVTNGPARSYACAPLIASGRAFGVLHMSAAPARAFTAEQLQLFSTLGNNLAIALERAHLFQRVEQMAKTDPLTGLFNHREFRARLSEELRRAERFGQPLALLLIDLDQFKQHNDRFGHPAGDAVLRRFAELGRAQLRQVDFFARYGGEEFAILLTNTELEGARLVAEKLRAAVEQESFHGNSDEPIVRKTVSIGVGVFPTNAPTDDELIRLTDEALYAAKHSGRNCVCAAAAPS